MAGSSEPVLILGGGINGAAVARELLLNGVPVRLVDKADLNSGATAYSSRLIHGGLRYLEYGELDLVRESLAERGRLLRLAPQFVRVLELMIPVESRFSGAVHSLRKLAGWSAGAPQSRGLWLIRAGLLLYDRYTTGKGLPPHRCYRSTRPDLPRVNARRYPWLCAYHDAQIVYPERFVLAMLRDAQRLAEEQGVLFQVLPYHEAQLQSGSVVVRPVPLGRARRSKTVRPWRPPLIVNATGAWIDRTLERLQVPSERLIGGTKGSHFLTHHPRMRELLTGRGVYAEARDGRPIFMLPFADGVLVGTTDLPFEDCPGKAVASQEELEYLMDAVNHVFPDARLTLDDVTLHYSGVRPLPYQGRPGTPAAITRRHILHQQLDRDPPIFSLIGGKLTTCRSFAEETAAAILKHLGRQPIANSRERYFPGGEDYPSDESALELRWAQIAAQKQITMAQAHAVWQLCGTDAGTRIPWASDRHDKPHVGDTSLPPQFVRAVLRNEWVTRLEDLVERRLMLLYDRRLSLASLRELARLMVEEGLLAEEAVEQEVASCCERLQRHYGRQVHRGTSS